MAPRHGHSPAYQSARGRAGASAARRRWIGPRQWRAASNVPRTLSGWSPWRRSSGPACRWSRWQVAGWRRTPPRSTRGGGPSQDHCGHCAAPAPRPAARARRWLSCSDHSGSRLRFGEHAWCQGFAASACDGTHSAAARSATPYSGCVRDPHMQGVGAPGEVNFVAQAADTAPDRPAAHPHAANAD